MQQNVIIAGVGGQGILSIAKAVSGAAVARGLHVKQAEVHGMSQRGGAVQSHLRVSDEPIRSDLIPTGKVTLLLAVEPLEALRHLRSLGPEGVVVAASNAMINIGNYPPVEEVLDRLAQAPRHVIVDAERLAKVSGSARSANIVMLGAASAFLGLPAEDLERAVARMFADKGDKVVESNLRALRIGRGAATAYVTGIEQGGTSRAVRRWVDTLTPERLEDPRGQSGPCEALLEEEDHLSGAESHAVERLLAESYESGRRALYEHEVYQIVRVVGAIAPPRHVFLSPDDLISEEVLSTFPGERVVLKIVSPDVVHKSDAQGLIFCPRTYPVVTREIDRLISIHRAKGARVEGVLVVECVEPPAHALGDELFVGIRATREFGPVIAAGLGGVDMEYMARAMRPGVAVAKAVATDVTGAAFLDQFRHTAAYEMMSGRARGHRRLVSDGELLRCFRAFLGLARRFCVDRGQSGPDLGELEVNPFSFRNQRLVPLDGRGRLATATARPAPRPLAAVQHLLEPRSISVLGVSAKGENFGRIILRNIRVCGFDPRRITVIKPGHEAIDGVACVPSVSALPEPTDLLVVAAAADGLPQLMDECVASRKVRSIIVIPGGAGETETSRDIPARLRAALAQWRIDAELRPVVLGPNCLGVQSRPGNYDTFFIPDHKLDKRRESIGSGVALLSQSGAFIVSRLSCVETLDPTISVSLGNQADLTLSDLVGVVGNRPDIHSIGVYAEGFNDLDGLDTLRAVRRVTEMGKTVVFYKAGRTEQGRDAAAGHTASVAGDYDICEAGLSAAGAIVADTFREFEQLVELSAALHSRTVRGRSVAAVTNAGFEAVGIADRVRGTGYEVRLPPLPDETAVELRTILARHSLSGLVTPRNPLDLTPMAGEAAYEDACRVLLASAAVDALLVAAVPLTPALATTRDELEQRRSLVGVLDDLQREFDKPIVAVVDAGHMYDHLARQLRERRIAVFRSADQAVRSLGRYVARRLDSERPREPSASAMEAKTASPHVFTSSAG